MGTTPPCLPAFCLWNTNSRNAAVFINTHKTVLNMLNAVFVLQFNVTQLWSNAFLLLFILVPLSRFGVLRGAAEDQDPVSGGLSLLGITSILWCPAGKHPPIPAPLSPFRIILEGRWGWSCPGGSAVKNLPGMPKMQETRVNLSVRKTPWRRAWQPTPVFLPAESQPGDSEGQGSPACCRSRGLSQTQLD